jgi:RNA polymerase sigma-70 factor, ECF subfamily
MELMRNQETAGDEGTLIRRGLRGDQQALEALFTRHARTGFQGALKLLGNVEDAEDALQEGLISAFRNLRRFEGRSKFSTWLTRIVINAALMRRRSQRAHEMAYLDDQLGEAELTLSEQLADPGADPEEAARQAELNEVLQGTLDGLSPVLRSAFELREVDELSTQEAAQTLAVPENTLKSRVRRARIELRDRLEHQFRDDGPQSPFAPRSGRPLALAD